MKTSTSKKLLVWLVALLLVKQVALAQKTDGEAATDSKYHFTQAWTWEYANDFDDVRGELKVYADMASGTFLFTKEAYGNSDYEADFVIADQKGIYLTGHTDDKGNKTMDIDTLEQVGDVVNVLQSYEQEFMKVMKLTGEKKIFGANKSKWPVIEGQQYLTTFDPPTSTSLDYLAKMNFTLLPIYFFNQRQEVLTKLPYNFSGALPPSYLLLENTYESDGKKITILLKSVEPVDKTIDILAYKK